MGKRCLILCIVGITLLFHSNILLGKDFHVSTTGNSQAVGSEADPWDLQTALNHPGAVEVGDSILLHGGTYYGQYTSNITGQPGNHIVIKNYQNDDVVLDGNIQQSGVVLSIHGGYVTFLNLTVTNSCPDRVSQVPDEPTDMHRVDGINIYNGDNVRIINCLVYDNPGVGLSAWTAATNTEVYGCLIFRNGWQNPQRPAGHNVYTQNSEGIKTYRDNIIFDGFGNGISTYTESGSIQGFRYEGNIFFNNGVNNSGPTLQRSLLLGGYQPIDRVEVVNNYFYHDSESYPSSKANVQFGYDQNSPLNENFELTGNVIYGGSHPLIIMSTKSGTVENNTLVDHGTVLNFYLPDGVSASSFQWDYNTYFSLGWTPLGHTVEEWKPLYGYDANCAYKKSLPTQNQVYVRPNQYTAGRGHIVVYNWEKLDTVNVDLSNVLTSGSDYVIYDVQNLKGQPVVQGTYSGDHVAIPLNLTEVTPANGNVPTQPLHTGIEFGAYLVSVATGSF
jgi:hypothetical protein